jgi:carbamoyl-phosphate synthase small subunit
VSGLARSVRRPRAHLVLADGEVFEGEAAGALPEGGVATGELVFNTALSGYQEVVTDPSYAGQMVAFTTTHIGNYGTNATDDEAGRPHLLGVVVRDLTVEASNWRSSEGFEAFLVRHGIPAITGIDTRRLTRHLRTAGAMPCAFGTGGIDTVRTAAGIAPSTDGRDLVAGVTTPEAYRVGEGPFHVVAYDFGIKTTMVRHLGAMARVTVVPAATGADEVLSLGPDGVFLSNGPGDPAALSGVSRQIGELVGRVPIFGICLGHQLLATALGGTTYKLPFGHHGSNHPVQRVSTMKVEVTSQNHNYAVAADSVPGAVVTHVNLNDGVIEGLAVSSERAFSVQYHPEAGPGPHDARYLFDEFATLMEAEGGIR